jgi:hypothetical protein
LLSAGDAWCLGELWVAGGPTVVPVDHERDIFYSLWLGIEDAL